MLTVVRWKQGVNFTTLSCMNGTVAKLAAAWKLRNGQAVVVTSKGWHRLRLIARLGDRAVMLIPDTPAASTSALETLARWAAQSLRDGVTFMNAWKEWKEAAA